MLRFLTVLGVMRLSRSSKMRPMRRAPEAARFTLAPVPFEVSLSWTASNRAGVTIGACSPGLARAHVVELAHIEPIPQDMGDLRLWRSGAAERSQDSLVGLWWVRIFRKVGLIDERVREKLD
jgi:hypothetical protein